MMGKQGLEERSTSTPDPRQRTPIQTPTDSRHIPPEGSRDPRLHTDPRQFSPHSLRRISPLASTDHRQMSPLAVSVEHHQFPPHVPVDSPPVLQEIPPGWSPAHMARPRLLPPPLVPIPDIVVESVPTRDAFGHSRTPPFVPSPSEWSGGAGLAPRWSLPRPLLGSKPRALSDSSILTLGSSDAFSPPASKQDEKSVFHFEDLPSSPHTLTVPSIIDSKYTRSGPVPMETSSPSSSETRTTSGLPEASETSSTESHSPSIERSHRRSCAPYMKHFHHLRACGLEKSPKTYWLRRHSDTACPESADSASGTIRSHSAGDVLPESPNPDREPGHRHALGISPLALSSSEERQSSDGTGAESGEKEDVIEGSEEVVASRLKLKKYLQKRYQMSQQRHQLSSDTDDVFSDRGLEDTPSPRTSVSTQPLLESPSKHEGNESKVIEGSEEASMRPETSRFRKPPALVLIDQPTTKRETSGGDPEPETPVFASPSIRASASAGAVLEGWPSPVFQFRSGSLDRDVDSLPSTPCERYSSGGRGVRPRRQAAVDTPDPIQREMTPEDEPTVGARAMPESPLVTGLSAEAPEGLRFPYFSSIAHPRLPFISYPSSVTSPRWTSEPGPSSTSQSSSPSQESSSLSPNQPLAISPGGTRSTKLEPSKIIYCPFSEQVQEQRHSRDPSSTFMCPACGQVFPSYNYLANHMVNHLPSEVVPKGPGDSTKVHLCKVCNRSFSRSDMLTRHMRLHTGLRPYECRTCGQVFSRSDHLHTHVRTHTGEKPYRCPQCPYAAPRRDMITRHMRIHMKHVSPRRGRRAATSTSSSIEGAPTEQPLSPHPRLKDVRRRNQSLSSVESADSSIEHASFGRRTSSLDLPEVESLMIKNRSWSGASEGSTEYAPGDGERSRRASRPLSLTSVESADYPSPRDPQSPSYRHRPALQRRFFFQIGGSSSSGDSVEGGGGPGMWRSGRSTELMDQSSPTSHHHVLSPVLSPTQQDPSSSPCDTISVETSLQKCRVTCDKDSTTGSDKDVVMSPSGDDPP